MNTDQDSNKAEQSEGKAEENLASASAARERLFDDFQTSSESAGDLDRQNSASTALPDVSRFGFPRTTIWL